jgi:hypothetical protein
MFLCKLLLKQSRQTALARRLPEFQLSSRFSLRLVGSSQIVRHARRWRFNMLTT